MTTSIDRFADSVRYHFAHPPADWTIRRIDSRRWAVINTAGDTIDTHPTRSAAEHAAAAGPYVRIWSDRTAWYLGTTNDPRNRTLTPEELRTIATVLTDLDHPEAPAARHRAWPDTEFCDLCDLPLTGPDRLCPNCDHCDTEDCTNPLNDGEGYDGYCGDCADRRANLYD
ncbi:hypothetical protein [Mycolicibacterium holsaticum]|uniref:Uncharacterized protein n=1 Tax=Mycolicibacterium holsaticum TaxID=152142 RepID=A0A1E3S1I2_9MYCO|nr:hypothetical protein [Mycolicibacterium holsaticum]ODQ95562.1 hypothetical protein BHQ17_04580 [Mycolicibacterium holsaticum]